jgi:hypothetical protein
VRVAPWIVGETPVARFEPTQELEQRAVHGARRLEHGDSYARIETDTWGTDIVTSIGGSRAYSRSYKDHRNLVWVSAGAPSSPM